MELCRCCYYKTPVNTSKNILIERYDNETLLNVIAKLSGLNITEDDPFPKEICEHCQHTLIFICDFIKLVTRTHQKFREDFKKESSNPGTTHTSQKINEINHDDDDNDDDDYNDEDDDDDDDDDDHDYNVEDDDDDDDEDDDDYVENIGNNDNKRKRTDEQENQQLNSSNLDMVGPINDNSKIDENKNVQTNNVKPECRICKRTFTRMSHVQRHLKLHDKPYKCPSCLKRFAHFKEFNDHIKSHNTKQTEFPCTICDRALRSARDLQRHLLTHNRFVCQICDKTFARNYDLKRHLGRHSIQNSYDCKICKKTFAVKENLRRHSLVHCKDGFFGCYICGKIFPTKSQLETHLHSKTVHIGNESVPCNICKETFDNVDALHEHFIPHFVDVPLKCKICKKCFNVKCNYNQHMSSLHGR